MALFRDLDMNDEVAMYDGVYHCDLCCGLCRHSPVSLLPASDIKGRTTAVNR